MSETWVPVPLKIADFHPVGTLQFLPERYVIFSIQILSFC